MFFKRKCMSCERLTTDLHRQNEKNLASSESIKKLEAKNEELRQELSAEREKKRELLSTISSLRDELFASNMENKKRTQEEPTKQIAGQGRPFSESLLQEKWHLKKVRKPTKASIIRALNCIFHKQTSPLGRIFLQYQSPISVGGISEIHKAEIFNYIEANASEVAETSNYSGAPGDFGAALVNDSRTWDQLAKVHIAAIIRSIEKQREKKEYSSAKWAELQPKLVDAIEQNKASLLSNLRRALKRDEYGSVELDIRNDEILRFLNSARLLRASRSAGIGRVQRYIKSWAKREEKKVPISSPLPTSGIDFEYWVADRLREYGWEATVSQGSGDQGIDVVATKESMRVAIQCKLYEGSVGNKAVQETIAGMSFYDLHQGAVVSTGKFTRSARELAQKNKILLLSVEDIPHLSDLL